MTSQVGKFYSGTYGYPIRIRLGVKLTIADIASISLVLINPTGGRNTISLDPSTQITNTGLGEITYTPGSGDLATAGTYELQLTVTGTGSQVLTAKALMSVL